MIFFLFFLLLLGAFAGILAGLLGIGGGVILVPGLYFVFSSMQDEMGLNQAYLMHLSVGTSLAIIVPTGISSAFSHYKRGSVDFNLVKLIGFGVVIGVIIATFTAKGLSGKSMQIIFATIICLLALIMITGRSLFQHKEGYSINNIGAFIAGTIIGSISTLIGIGGATLSVPYMTMNGVPMRKAIGSASAIGVVIATFATIGFIIIGWGIKDLPPYSLGYVNLLALVCIAPISVMAAPFGARIAHKISVGRMKLVFAIFMILVALNMWRKILMGG